MKLRFSPVSVKSRQLRLGICGATLATLALVVWFFQEVKQIRAQPMTSWQTTRHADCGIVLTGGPGRVREGFDVLSQGLVRKLIISGVHEDVRLRELLPQKTFYGNLNESNIVLERRSGSTYGNAQQSLPFIEAFRCREVLLITSRSHIYRAMKTFRGALPSGILIYEHPVVSGRYWPDRAEVWQEAFKSMFYSFWAY